MREDTGAQLHHPGTFSEDALTEILRLGARRLLVRAVEMEVTAFIERHADLQDIWMAETKQDAEDRPSTSSSRLISSTFGITIKKLHEIFDHAEIHPN